MLCGTALFESRCLAARPYGLLAVPVNSKGAGKRLHKQQSSDLDRLDFVGGQIGSKVGTRFSYSERTSEAAQTPSNAKVGFSSQAVPFEKGQIGQTREEVELMIQARLEEFKAKAPAWQALQGGIQIEEVAEQVRQAVQADPKFVAKAVARLIDTLDLKTIKQVASLGLLNEIMLDEKQVSLLTGRSPKSLRNDRNEEKGIPFYKVEISVRYKLRDVLTYMKSKGEE